MFILNWCFSIVQGQREHLMYLYVLFLRREAMHKCKEHAKITVCKTQYATNSQISPSDKSILEAFKHLKVF